MAEDNSCRSLPVGCTFQPSDQLLLFHFLPHKIKQNPLAYNGDIADVDVYGDKYPWEIFDEKKTNYVYTTLKKKPGKIRAARRAGDGTWHNSNPAVKIRDDKNKNVFGYKKTFSFKLKNETVGNWIMHEYSLVSGENSSDYVLCSIHKKKIKKSGDQEETSVNEREIAGTDMTVMTPPDATQPSSYVTSYDFNSLSDHLMGDEESSVDEQQVAAYRSQLEREMYCGRE